jgi:hypothetical protein
MAWTHTKGEKQFNRSIKPVEQLQQEAAAVLVQGGGWQCIIMGTRSGYLDESSTRLGAKVASFVRARQAVCHGARSVPQVAVILPETAMRENLDANGIGYRFHEINRSPLIGLLRLFLHTHFSVDVRSERQVCEGLEAYPLLALPECHTLPGEVSLKDSQGKWVVHLVNAQGLDLAPRQSAWDHIEPVRDIRIHLRIPKEPEHVKFAFGGRILEKTYRDGVLTVALEELNIHDALVVTP